MFDYASNITIHDGTFTQYQDKRPERILVKLLRRLRPPEFLDWAARLGRTRVKNTCEWSTRHPMVDRWLHSNTVETSRLWLHGGPGTGKSVLAAYLIEKKKSNKSQDEVVFYAFCMAQGNVKVSSGSIILGFLRQYLVDYSTSLVWQIVDNLHNTVYSEREDYPFTIEQLMPLLLSVLKLFKKSCFIIDGVDECDTEVLGPGGLIEILFGLDMPARLLFLSRREAAVSMRLNILPQVELGADGTTHDDIRELVSVTVEKLASEFPVLEESKEKLKEGLLTMAGNMFLVVKLKEDAIRDQYPSSPAMVEEILNTLNDIPEGLEEMYEGLFLEKRKKWGERLTNLAVRSLQWLMYSRTPVTQSLLRVAVAINADSGVLCVDDLDSCIEMTMKHVLGVLIDWQTADSGVLHATLVHHSLREYIISKGLPFEYHSRISPDHLFKICCAVLHCPGVRESLQVYHRSADKRRQGRGIELQRVLCQEEPWEKWEQRQKKDLDEEKQWRAKEMKRVREELEDLGDEVLPEFIENQDKYLKLLQEMQDGERQEVLKLMDLLYLPERELMIYALNFLPYHLAEVLGQTDRTSTATTTAAGPLTTAMLVLVEDINSHAALFFEEANISQPSPSRDIASANLSITSQSLAKTTNAIKRLVESDVAFVDEDQVQSHGHGLTLSVRHTPKSHPSTDPKAIWNDTVVWSFESAKLPTPFMYTFNEVTLALTNLRDIESALHNFDKHTVVAETSILVDTLRRTAHMLSLWMIVYGYRCMKKDEFIQALLGDSFLYPNLLRSPQTPRSIKPAGVGILLFDYDLWSRHSIHLSFALVLSFVVGVINPLPLSTSTLVMLLCSGSQRYGLPTHHISLYRIIHSIQPVLIAGHIFLRFYMAMVVVAVGYFLQVTRLMRFRCSKIHGNLYFRADIIDLRLLNILAPIISQGVLHYPLLRYSIWFGLAIILFIERSFDFVLGVAMIYFAVKWNLLGVADSSGLSGARPHLGINQELPSKVCQRRITAA